MSPAVQDALNQFIIQFLSFAGVILTVGGIAAKAYIDRRIRRKDKADEEALKTREGTRDKEREAERQKTLRLEAELESVKAETAEKIAIGKNLVDLNATVIRLIESYTKEKFADREVASNHIQSLGDLSESVEKVAAAVVDNNSLARTTNAKVDAAVAAIEHLETILNSGVREIKLLLKPTTDAGDLADLPKAAGL